MARGYLHPRSPKSPLSPRQVHRAMVILDASSGTTSGIACPGPGAQDRRQCCSVSVSQASY
jgi:hypothetical protein